MHTIAGCLANSRIVSMAWSRVPSSASLTVSLGWIASAPRSLGSWSIAWIVYLADSRSVATWIAPTTLTVAAASMTSVGVGCTRLSRKSMWAWLSTTGTGEAGGAGG